MNTLMNLKRNLTRFIFCLMMILPSFAAEQASSHWKGFRGDGTSLTLASNLPLKWDERSNILWKTKLNGFGQSSPVTWNGKGYLTSVSSENEERLHLICVSLENGNILWEKRFKASVQLEYTRMLARAAPTPAVDETGLYVFFGSGDLMKLTHGGDVIWKRSLTKEYGSFEGNHGMSTSPLRWKDQLIQLVAHQGPSYLLSINIKDGKNRWKVDRDSGMTFSTPLVTEFQGQPRLIVSATGMVESFNLETGERMWRFNEITKNAIASPSAYKDQIIVGSSEEASTTALKLGGEGELDKTHVIWQGGSASSFGSPLVHNDQVYMVNRAGILSCLNAKSGELIWKHRMPASCWASPIGAGDRLYFFGKDGITQVLAANSPKPLILAENKLPVKKDDEVCGAAIDGEMILLRTGSELTCIKKS